MTSPEDSASSCWKTAGLRAEWSHAERYHIEEQWYNACGRPDSEGGRPPRPAAVLVRFEQAHVHAAPAARPRRSSSAYGQVVSRPSRSRLAHDAAAASSAAADDAALHHAAQVLAASQDAHAGRTAAHARFKREQRSRRHHRLDRDAVRLSFVLFRTITSGRCRCARARWS